MGILPDYTESVAEVYKDAFVRFLRSSGILILDGTPPGGGLSGAPSWVPDWTTSRTYNPIDHTLTSMKSKAVLNFVSDDILEVFGKEITRVKSIRPIYTTIDNYQCLDVVRSLISPYTSRTRL
jgi:hypothetical protein